MYKTSKETRDKFEQILEKKFSSEKYPLNNGERRKSFHFYRVPFFTYQITLFFFQNFLTKNLIKRKVASCFTCEN